MSLLLDALNKADQERKRNEASPGINSNHEQRIDDEAPDKSWLLIAAIVVGVGILLAAIYWLGQRSTATPSATTDTTVSSVKAALNNKKNVTTEPQKTAETTEQNITSEDAPDESVTNLYQQTQVPPANTAITISTPTQPGTEPVPEAEPVTAENIDSPVSITQYANLPELHDLPNNMLERVPTLTYSEHNYNINGGTVKINGEIKHENDQLGNGIVIDKILEDGMILHIENYSFKMRAMNSWINM